MRPSPEYLADLDRRVTALVRQLGELYPELNLEWPLEYLDAGEYGLSLLSLIEGLIEINEKPPRDLSTELVALTQPMDLGFLQADESVLAWLRDRARERSGPAAN